MFEVLVSSPVPILAKTSLPLEGSVSKSVVKTVPRQMYVVSAIDISSRAEISSPGSQTNSAKPTEVKYYHEKVRRYYLTL